MEKNTAQKFKLAVSFEWSLKTEGDCTQTVETAMGKPLEGFAISHGRKEVQYFFSDTKPAREARKTLEGKKMDLPGLIFNIVPIY